jgi:hypothetical protein
MRYDPREGPNETSQRPPAAELVVSCARCGALHVPDDALAFDPLCAACARHMRPPPRQRRSPQEPWRSRRVHLPGVAISR